MPAPILLSESLGRSRYPMRAFGLSLLFHGLIVLPLWTEWGVFAPSAPAATTPAPAPTTPSGESYQFIELPPAPAAPPERPTRLLAAAAAQASQPESVDRPPGAAFQAGRSPVPSAEGRRDDLALRTPAARAPDGLLDRPDSLTPDQRLAIPRQGIGRRATGALPEPRVDQRLTRAEVGSAFSLNTTAWDYA
ncbi:MAG: hypothetical protein LC798_21355, partial [Chloroflexi bacterium]|nr:hypothetical protein [Chloroflexota bacterium]